MRPHSSSPKSAGQNQESVQEVSKQGDQMLPHRYPKTDVRYWQDAVFRPTYTRGGQTQMASGWMVKIRHLGRRENFSLHTANRTAAAARAKEIYQHIVGAGWEPALRKWKPSAEKIPTPVRIATVGEFLSALKATSTVKPKTLEGYAKAFRMIVAR